MPWRKPVGKNGTHYVHSFRTGKTYVVEPIKPNATYKGKGWGDQDPASGKVTGNYGNKHNGAITADQSVITPENGFKNIQLIKRGSPYWAIQKIDIQYPNKQPKA